MSSTAVSVRYLDIGSNGQARLIASDANGNLFAVATINNSLGRPQIRVTKTDPQGKAVASLDFGGKSSDVPLAATVDPSGNLVVVGTSNSSDFPSVAPIATNTTVQTGFIVKVDPELKNILFATRLGGTQAGGGPNPGSTSANAVTVDRTGNIYVAGSTNTTDFPVTAGAFQTQPPRGDGFGSPTFAFIAAVGSSSNKILFSSYFGGSTANCSGGSSCIGVFGYSSANAIAVDAIGSVVIAGNTTASNLPITAGTLGQQCSCANITQAGFVARVGSNATQLIWGTYIPLAQVGAPFQTNIFIQALGVDPEGSVIIGGTAPMGFPVTKGALQTTYPGGNPPPTGAPYAGFISKIDSQGKQYLFSTYLGGNVGVTSEQNTLPVNGVKSIALDAQGNIWATGGSRPSELPLPAGTPALGPTYIAALSPDGTKLVNILTAPSGAVGQSLLLTHQGGLAALGNQGSILLSSPSQLASLVAVANAAAFQASGRVAPYELISLYGIGIGPTIAQGGQIVAGSLTTSLGGAQVLFDGVAAPLLYAGANQINAIVPGSVSGRLATALRVVTPTGSIEGTSMNVTPSQPEVFTTDGSAIALNQDGTINSPTNPATKSWIVTVWATGGGLADGSQSDGAVVTGTLRKPQLPVSVLVNPDRGPDAQEALELLYAGDAPGMVTGVLQINFRLPAQLAVGVKEVICRLQIGTASSATFRIYVAP